MLMICLSIQSQDLKLKEVLLPAPTVLSLKYFKTLGERHIFYGKTPKKPNGKVILFVPGYLEEADFLLLKNSFYKNAYNEGYQTAFVSMTRGQGDWVNGEILQRAIQQVKDYYKVSKMDIVAHSNGGKASEVALFHYGKIVDVNKIVTLGTPFKGTQIADFGGLKAFSWVLDILGVDTGRAYSTTYYCETQWRPYFDKIETAAQKKQYFNYGAWGYLHGKEILFSGAMAATGIIIKLNGGGANDGVTPFYSSSIPGGNQLYKDNAQEGKMDHMDMVYGQHTWKNFSKVLKDNYVLVAPRALAQSESDDSEYTVSSNYQLSSDTDYFGNIQKEKGSTQLKITLLKEDQKSSFSLVEKATSQTRTINAEPSNLASSVILDGLEKNKYVNELIISFTPSKLKSTVSDENKQFDVVGNSRFLAIAEQDVESPMNYTFKNTLKKTILEVNFPNLTKDILSNISVTGYLSYLGSLDGTLSSTQEKKSITFTKKGNKFVYDASSLNDGVYSLAITGYSVGAYKRDLISGFTVGQLTSTAIRSVAVDDNRSFETTENNPNVISVYPNPTTDILNVSVKDNASYSISNVQGRNGIMSGKLVSGNNIIDVQKLAKGIYLLNVKNDLSTESLKFIVK